MKTANDNEEHNQENTSSCEESYKNMSLMYFKNSC